MITIRQRYDGGRLRKQVQLTQCWRERRHVVKVHGETRRGRGAELHSVEVGIQMCRQESQPSNRLLSESVAFQGASQHDHASPQAQKEGRKTKCRIDKILCVEHCSENEVACECIQGDGGGVIEKEAQCVARKGNGEWPLGSNESWKMGRGIQQVVEGSGTWGFSMCNLQKEHPLLLTFLFIEIGQKRFQLEIPLVP